MRWVVALTIVMGAASRAEAQYPQERHGFWLSVGTGYGTLGCKDCDSREGSFSGNLALGGTVSPKVLLGGAVHAWTKSEDGVDLTVGTVTALIRFYPSVTSGFFLTGGLGYGTIEVAVDGLGDDSESGAGAVLGLGYDIRIGRNVSLSPFGNWFAMNSDNADANVAQIGLGITVH